MTQPPMPDQPTPPAGGAGLPLPFKVRFNPQLGFTFFAVGFVWLVLGIAGNNFYFILAVVFLLTGAAYQWGTCAIIEADRVKVLSPAQITMKNEPIQGLGDLRFDGAKLYRVSDNKKIGNLGWGSASGEDLKRLQAAVGGAARG